MARIVTPVLLCTVLVAVVPSVVAQTQDVVPPADSTQEELAVDVANGAADVTDGAAEADSDSDNTLGLVLAGGGALGFAHVGVLLVLEEYGISPEIVVGTSMGGIAGALYAAGYTPRQILAITESIDWNGIFFDEVNRRQASFDERRADRLSRGRLSFTDGRLQLLSGASAGQSIMELLDDLLRSAAPVEDFHALPRSLSVVAADLVTGEQVVFRRGDVKNAVRASMAVPGAFTPVFYDGRFLIDGGWVNNTPVDVARTGGADHIIAVNLNLLNVGPEDLQDIPAILNQSSRIVRQVSIEENLARADVVITPELAGFTPADFGEWETLVQRGRAAALEALPELLEIRDASIQHHVSRDIRPEEDVSLRIRSVNPRVPHFVEFPGTQEVVRNVESAFADGETSVSAVQEAVYNLYDAGGFHSVTYDLVPVEDNQFDLDLYLMPRDSAASELHVGAGVRSQLFESTYVRSILYADFRTALAPPTVFGGELDRRPRFDAEAWISDVASARVGLSFPLAPSLRFRGRGYSLSTPVPFYDSATVEALYFQRSAGADLGLQLQPGREWRFDVTGFGEWAWVDRIQGASVLDDDAQLRVGVAGLARHDNLDRAIHPTRGTETRVSGRLWWQPDALQPLVRAEMDHRSYVPVSPETTLEVKLSAGTDLDTGLPPQDQFYEGGVERVSGFYFGELSGRHALTAGLAARRRIFRLPLGVGQWAYLVAGMDGARIWSGNLTGIVTPDEFELPRLGGKLGVSLDTVLGELSAGLAINDGGRIMSYVLLGPTATPSGEIWSW
ncbi:MAG: patatin-like phospholipase family protein [Alkalispirochaeta sp.]